MDIVRHGAISYDQLLTRARHSSKGNARYILHTLGSKNMQCMIIAFAPHTLFPFINDNLPGRIVFTCLFGSVTIKLATNGINEDEAHTLCAGEVLVLPRSVWRSTIAGPDGAVFLESIEGEHNPILRGVKP